MQTPKEKAQALVERFYADLTRGNKNTDPAFVDYETSRAKLCAISCVDEIIKVLERTVAHPQNKIDLQEYQSVKMAIKLI